MKQVKALIKNNPQSVKAAVAEIARLSYQTRTNINSWFLTRLIGDFCRYVEKPTVLVFDKAPVHCSKQFQ